MRLLQVVTDGFSTEILVAMGTFLLAVATATVGLIINAFKFGKWSGRVQEMIEGHDRELVRSRDTRHNLQSQLAVHTTRLAVLESRHGIDEHEGSR